MKKKTHVKRKYTRRKFSAGEVARKPNQIGKNTRPENKLLRIHGPTPDFSGLKIAKGLDVPRARGSYYWDHLINKLDKGDA